MPEPSPGNWERAVAIRRERLQLIQAVLEIQRRVQMQEGRDPTAEEVARELEE